MSDILNLRMIWLDHIVSILAQQGWEKREKFLAPAMEVHFICFKRERKINFNHASRLNYESALKVTT